MRSSDWSSDVCSSDLLVQSVARKSMYQCIEKVHERLVLHAIDMHLPKRTPPPRPPRRTTNRCNCVCFHSCFVQDDCKWLLASESRSDESRVGKECVSTCRSRGSQCI